MESKKEIFFKILKEDFAAFIFIILIFGLMGLCIFYRELYWGILAFLIIICLYLREALASYRRYGITRSMLFFLGLSCVSVVVFYASIYTLYGFNCDGRLYIYGSVPFDIFRVLNSIYFSVATFTTLGYGDCKPIPELRLVCVSEAIAGYMYLGVLVGCIITYVTKKAKHKEKQEEKNLIKEIRKPRKFSKTFNCLFVPKELLERHKQELIEKQTQRHNRRFNVKTSKNKLKYNKKNPSLRL